MSDAKMQSERTSSCFFQFPLSVLGGAHFFSFFLISPFDAVAKRLFYLQFCVSPSLGYLKLGEVLYLGASRGTPRYGYVITKGMPVSRRSSGSSRGGAKVGVEANGGSDGTPGSGALKTEDVIDLLDDGPGDDNVAAPPPPSHNAASAGASASPGAGTDAGAGVGASAAGTVPHSENGGGSATHKEECQPRGSVRGAAKRATGDGKGTAENPCELLSSDDEEEEEVVLRHVFPGRPVGGQGRGRGKGSGRGRGRGDKESTGRGAADVYGGRGRGRPGHQPQQSKRDAQRASNAQQQRQEQQQSHPWGRWPYSQGAAAPSGFGPQSQGAAGPSGFAQQRPEGPVASEPPQPDPSHPDDTPTVLASRANLMSAWRAVCSAQKMFSEVEQSLRAKQAEYHEIILQAPSVDDTFMAHRQHTERVNFATAAVHAVATQLRTAHTAVGVAAAQHKRACEDLDMALAVMARERRSAAQQRKGEAIASEFQAEIRAWDLVEQTTDLNIFPAGELKRIAKAMGVDITGCVEKAELAIAITEKREVGREAWVARKRKRAAEEEIAARQRRKLAELREEESKRAANESAQASARQRAVSKVASWGHRADLRLFLQRCGIKVDGGGGNTKGALTKSYRRAMMKFHPDRTRSASLDEQALAAEVTKWITQAWQTLRD